MGRSVQEKLSKLPVTDFIWEEYRPDQEINNRGIAFDMAAVKNVIEFDAKSRCELSEKMQELTELDNPSSVH